MGTYTTAGEEEHGKSPAAFAACCAVAGTEEMSW